MLLALFVITAVSGGILGLVYSFTKVKIDDENAKKNDRALHAVLPFDNIRFDTLTINNEGMAFPCHLAYDTIAKVYKGVAIKTSEGGFGGKIELMVGFSVDGTITGTSVLSHSETPGLGANMTGPFKDQFVDKNPNSYKLAVTKDGGDVDAITAATITSRAYTKAIDKAYRAFYANEEKAQAEGIKRRLPPPDEENDEDVKIDEKNIMHVLINSNDELFINGQPSDLSSLKNEAKQFMTPRPDDETAPEVELKEIEGLEGQIMMSKGFISLRTDRGVSYEMYLNVQNELAAAFNELRDELALKHFGKKFQDLNESQAKAISEAVPIRISEAEPVNLEESKGGTENE